MTTLRAAALLTLLSVSAHVAMADNESSNNELVSDNGQDAEPAVSVPVQGIDGAAPSVDAVSAGEGAAPLPSATYARVRLTWYAEAGVTYSGVWTYPGSTACSWNFPIGSRFRFPDGETFTCIDRGHLGSGDPVGWLDLFRRKDLADKYGPWAMVEVIP